MKSEYFGVRIAMHDALQRYYAVDTSSLQATDKVALLQSLVQAAVMENGLFEDGRKEMVGRAWAQFIGTRPPEAIAKFLSDPAIIAYSQPTNPPLSAQVQHLNLIDTGAILFKARNLAFEEIAQRTGIMNYQAGEELSAHLQNAERELRASGLTGPEAPAESMVNKIIIRTLFNSKFGKVKDEYLGGGSPRINPAVGSGRSV